MIHEKRPVKPVEIEKFMQFVVMLKEDDVYIAFCPILDESSEGDTIEEAQKNLREAIKLRLQDKNMPYPRETLIGVFVTHSFLAAGGELNFQDQKNVWA